jgi:hypothetical protein
MAKQLYLMLQGGRVPLFFNGCDIRLAPPFINYRKPGLENYNSGLSVMNYRGYKAETQAVIFQCQTVNRQPQDQEIETGQTIQSSDYCKSPLCPREGRQPQIPIYGFSAEFQFNINPAVNLWFCLDNSQNIKRDRFLAPLVGLRLIQIIFLNEGVDSLETSKKKMGAKEKILRYLIATAPEPVNTWKITQALGISKETAKRTLAKLYEMGEIEKQGRGFYRGKVTAERILALEQTEIQLHGIKIQFKAVELVKENGRFVPFWGQGISLRPLFNPQELVYQDDWKIVYRVEFSGRWTTITLHGGKPLCEVWLKCSENPLNYQEFKQFKSWLEGRFGNSFILGEPELIQVGLNRDYQELRMDGCNSLKLQKWENAWSQIYNKAERLLRVETHISTRIDLNEALDILDSRVGIVNERKPKVPEFTRDTYGASMYM